MGLTVADLINTTIEAEGGFTDHAKDAGNWVKNDEGQKILVGTNWGIAAPTLRDYWKRTPTMEEMKNLSREEAFQIYEANYFLKPKMDLLPADVQANVYDMGVNAGPSRAIKILQQLLQNLGYDVGRIDGRMGPGTVGIAQQAVDAGHDLRELYSDARIAFYEDLVQRKPKNQVFLKGWINRANHFRHVG